MSFQKDKRILVSTLAAYGGREIPQGFNWLKQSCEKFGIELTVFGEGYQFVNMYETKLMWLGRQLWELRNDYDYVINIDSSDCLFLSPLTDEFPFSEKITFMAERNCFPLEQLRDKHPDVHSTYKYLNAGGFHGSMKDVIKTFAYIEFDRATRTEPEYSTDGFANTFTDDQARWIVSYLQGYVNIDHQCKFGQTLWGVDKIPSVNNKDIYIGHGVLLNLEHQTRPFILHGNGSANYDEIYKQMIL